MTAIPGIQNMLDLTPKRFSVSSMLPLPPWTRSGRASWRRDAVPAGGDRSGGAGGLCTPRGLAAVQWPQADHRLRARGDQSASALVGIDRAGDRITARAFLKVRA